MVVPKPNYICELEKKQVAGTGLARWHRGIGKKPKHSAAVLPTTLASLVIFKKGDCWVKVCNTKCCKLENNIAYLILGYSYCTTRYVAHTHTACVPS